MPIKIEGETYPSIADAAKRFGVSTKTVYSYIEKGIIDQPPRERHGVHEIRTFPEEYMQRALVQIDTYVTSKRKEPRTTINSKEQGDSNPNG